MSAARDDVLDRLRRANAGAAGRAEPSEIDARLAAPEANLVPARGQLAPGARVDLFVAMAEEAAASVARIDAPDAVPAEVVRYLRSQNLPMRIAMAPDPGLRATGLDKDPLLAVREGSSDGTDETSVTGAFAGVAETGTLMLHSGPAGPTTLNFLPDDHIVVLRASQVVASYEDGWQRLRAAGGAMPRTVNFITGPSRSADIEQTLQMGAHGPRRLHIVLVEDL
ncbi:MAG: lactate utilization protein [Rhodospirillaceae bacterium]|jgi:L-lactate dehydrogenase complex protein LldG|nr:lactate utilization protein [Rhodospirillaceae bacterium]